VSPVVRIPEAPARGHAGPDARPRRATAVVTCMDARLDPEEILGYAPGDVHVIRNAGGAITEDVLDSLAVSQRRTGTRVVVVLHHTDCAGMAARRPGVPADSALHEAVEALRHDPRLPHRASISGALYDTARGALVHPPRERRPESRAPSTHPRMPATLHRCVWCERPFAPTGRGRLVRHRRYCCDICRSAARRAARGARRRAGGVVP
jgi:carbonic anhydrase